MFRSFCICKIIQDPKYALTLFERILTLYPNSTEAQLGKAKSLERLADINRNNGILRQAIDEYVKLVNVSDKLNDTLFKNIAEHCIERMRFLGECENGILYFFIFFTNQICIASSVFFCYLMRKSF